MTDEEQKVSAEERRTLLLQLLQSSKSHVTGTELAQACGVTRQVIVADIALLRAAKHPIIATPQGYQYQNYISSTPQKYTRVIPVRHSYEQTEIELFTMVDYGLHVLDVIVEHPIYGEITGALRLNNRRDVHKFLESLGKSNAYLLSSLTAGVHLHTVEADSLEMIEEACQALDKQKILLKD